jgi:hypothetical protein
LLSLPCPIIAPSDNQRQASFTERLHFGSIVSLICGDPDTATGVTIHIESEPLQSNLLSKVRRQAGCARPVQYAADRLTLHLDMVPADDGDGVQLIELDNADAATSNNAAQAVQDVNQ